MLNVTTPLEVLSATVEMATGSMEHIAQVRIIILYYTLILTSIIEQNHLHIVLLTLSFNFVVHK